MVPERARPRVLDLSRVALPWVAWASAATSAVALTVALWSLPDWRRIDFAVYYEAVDGASQTPLYDFRYHILGLRFLYPPFAALVLRPFTWVPYPVAEHAWLLLTVAASAAFLGLSAGLMGRRLPSWAIAAFVAVGLWTMPVFLTARLGQINAFVALAVALDVLALRRGSRYAGLGTGLDTALKLTPGLLVPFLWWTGRRRAAVVAAGTFVGASALAALFYPGDSARYWTAYVFGIGQDDGLARSEMSHGLLRILHGWEIDPVARTVLWLLFGGVVTWIAFRRAAREPVLEGTTLVLCASALVSPVTWGHDLYFLVVAGLLWTVRARTRFAWAVAALLAYALFDPFEAGEGDSVSFIRLVLLIVTIVALPRAVAWARPAGSSPEVAPR
jgi:alpha-1,2-mannosyltransferase